MDVNFSHTFFTCSYLSPESVMPRPFTRTLDLRHRHGALRESLPPHAMSARKAWATAANAREAVQARIVSAFRRDVEGTGQGPSEFDLHLFARLAVTERRLKRCFDRAKVQPPCRGVSPSTDRTADPRQGESP